MSRLERGIVIELEVATWTVCVELVESGHVVLSRVPLAWHIDSTQVIADVHCVLLLSDDLNPTTSVVLALYHGVAPVATLEF